MLWPLNSPVVYPNEQGLSLKCTLMKEKACKSEAGVDASARAYSGVIVGTNFGSLDAVSLSRQLLQSLTLFSSTTARSLTMGLSTRARSLTPGCRGLVQ